ncbi:unnamed protein product [Cuscuta epithymum]|uniref:Myb/SANT-like domain-containing protein n=1 Tax=Cuscuta epithymum TaxID=186058 RepID=A0AAV0DRW6_9ASTE|nr:unnamed protein product [Cuscuta epithymum]CAH9142375.1 unnamed protein product [Cuscuta epithymum]
MKFSSGFGWDPITKKFTASDEVWKNYLESRGAHKSSGSKKRTRDQCEVSSKAKSSESRSEFKTKVASGMDSIVEIASDIRGMRILMEKKEKRESENNIWDAIKETPNLDERTRYKVPKLIYKLGMKEAFLKMSPQERQEWIIYNIEEDYA